MTDEVTRFERRAERDDLVALRRADDAAKVRGKAVPGLDTWRTTVESVARPADPLNPQVASVHRVYRGQVTQPAQGRSERPVVSGRSRSSSAAMVGAQSSAARRRVAIAARAASTEG